MPIYEYKALGVNNKIKTGILDADTPKDARNKLRSQGIHIISLKVIKDKQQKLFPKFFVRRNIADLAMVTRQLATLMESGIALREAIGALIEQIEDQNMQNAFRTIREKITAGKSFANALIDHPVYFDKLYISMVNAGEAAGNLDIVLQKLADYLQAQTRMRGKVSAALAYPMVMMFIGAAVVLFLMTFVVPKIQSVFEAQEKALPLPTQILVAMSDFCVNWWWAMILVFFGMITGFKIAAKKPWGKRILDKAKLTMPVIGMLFKKQAVSRFAITFSTLLQSGLPALQALKIVRDIVDNVLMAETLEEVQKTIVEGGELATPLRKSKVFPTVVGYMISVGEKTGKMDIILKKIAEVYDEEIEMTTQKVTSILEPLMIVALAMIVGFIVVAIILPIMDMSQL